MSRLDLSSAIRRGAAVYPERSERRYLNTPANASCPLGAAFIGTLYGPADIQRFLGLMANSSDESINEFILMGLYKAFPQLGCSMAEFSRLRRDLGRNMPDDISYKHDGYTLSYPPSLFAVITHLHDQLAWDKAAIATTLARAGL